MSSSSQSAQKIKPLLIALVVIGCALETFGIHALTGWMQTQ